MQTVTKGDCTTCIPAATGNGDQGFPAKSPAFPPCLAMLCRGSVSAWVGWKMTFGHGPVQIHLQRGCPAALKGCTWRSQCSLPGKQAWHLWLQTRRGELQPTGPRAGLMLVKRLLAGL